MLDLALSRGWRIGGPAAAFLGITLTLVAAVRADDWDDCNSAVPDKIISGCAGIIEKNARSPADMSKAYARRGEWHRSRNMPDKALADFEQALKLDPQIGRAHV